MYGDAYLFVHRDSTATILDVYLAKSKTIYKVEKREKTSEWLLVLKQTTIVHGNRFKYIQNDDAVSNSAHLLRIHCRQTFQINNNDFHIFISFRLSYYYYRPKKWRGKKIHRPYASYSKTIEQNCLQWVFRHNLSAIFFSKLDTKFAFYIFAICSFVFYS